MSLENALELPEKRLFIFSSRSLFSEGIQSLLQDHAIFDVVGWEHSIETAVRSIQTTQPDIVLLISTKKDNTTWLIGQRLFQEKVKAVVMELNLQDNRICIYRGEVMEIEAVEDLLSIFENFHSNDSDTLKSDCQ